MSTSSDARSLVFVAALLACAPASGCKVDEGTNPLGAATATTLGQGGAAPLPDAGPIVRRVETRSPFGGPAGNLLFDGDFELSGPGLSQAPWTGFTQTAQAEYHLETGGICRSGVRCIVLEAGVSLYGRGVTARASGVVAELWVKPPATQNCKVVIPRLVDCISLTAQTSLFRDADEPGSEGYCHYQGGLGPRTVGVCMWITNSLDAGETAIADAATVLPDNGAFALQAHAPDPVGASEAARVAFAREWLRSHTIVDAPPAPSAQGPR